MGGSLTLASAGCDTIIARCFGATAIADDAPGAVRVDEVFSFRDERLG